MFRVLIVCFCILFADAETIHFQEEKYIEVVDNSFYKKGVLEFENKSIKLQYDNSKKVLQYKNDTLTLWDGDQKEPLEQNTETMIKMVFLLISSIYYDDMESLKEFFAIEIKESETLLLPKEGMSQYIETIHFSKDTKLNYLSIEMQNGNITTIKQIDE